MVSRFCISISLHLEHQSSSCNGGCYVLGLERHLEGNTRATTFNIIGALEWLKSPRYKQFTYLVWFEMGRVYFWTSAISIVLIHTKVPPPWYELCLGLTSASVGGDFSANCWCCWFSLIGTGRVGTKSQTDNGLTYAQIRSVHLNKTAQTVT